MIRWAIIEELDTNEGMIMCCNSYTEAVIEAKSTWEHLSKHNKKRYDTLMVGLVDGDDPAEVYYIGYDAIKGKEHLCFADIKAASEMNISEFSRAYGIPYRTVQNWNAGQQLQTYMLSLLAVAVFSNKEVNI